MVKGVATSFFWVVEKTNQPQIFLHGCKGMEIFTAMEGMLSFLAGFPYAADLADSEWFGDVISKVLFVTSNDRCTPGNHLGTKKQNSPM